MNNKEIVKKLLKGQTCKSCKWCRHIDDHNSLNDAKDYIDSEHYMKLAAARIELFKGREYICIGANDRGTQSLDERGWCDQWRRKRL